MLERKISSDKLRKHNAARQKSPPKFHKLFLNNDVVLPTKLQQFLSEGLRFPDNEKINSNKVRVVLKINESRDTPSCLTINKSQNCVGVIDPTPSRRSQTSTTHVNLFPFDSILTDSDSQEFIFTDSLVDPVLELFKGRDSCIFSFGHSGLGKTKSMVGSGRSISHIGIIPCALIWTFKLIDQLKRNNHSMRYFVSISAIEVSNKNNVCDLLANLNPLSKLSGDSKSQELSDQDQSNTILINQRELPASCLQEAACILDSALATRSNENESLTHLQLIIHLYHCRVDAVAERNCDSNNVTSKKSRLILLDLGSGRHGNEDQQILSLQGISKVILALYTSQRHVPYKENVLTQLLKDTLNQNFTTTMLLHISSKEQHYSETLQVVQLAYKLYRMRLKKYRSVGFSVSDETSSCSSSSSGLQSRRLRPHMGIGAARRSSGNSSASSEVDLTSASELSCCETVIFKGDTNHSLSDKSPDRMSGKRKLRSVSSDSDNGFSDMEKSKSLAYNSGNSLSPTIRHRMSPRTNARAWPSTNDSSNCSIEHSSETWVDGPKAVYNAANGGNPILDDRNYMNKVTEIGMNIVQDLTVKPTMISKETQCDDVWDSGSSITDGSSHSNTLDRKDHRPLSDISECTEETESNLATDSDLIKMNMIDQTEPTNVLDDLLESTFGLSPIHQGNQFKPLELSFLDSQEAHLQFIEKMKNPIEIPHSEIANHSIINLSDNLNFTEPVKEIQKPIRRDSSKTKKHSHLSSDSKKISKSEGKEKKSKPKCKKCSKSSDDNRSKSMTSSSSTNFSRVSSWIENVEYETQSSKSSKLDSTFHQYAHDGNQLHYTHHHSQPDISYQRDLFDINSIFAPSVHYQHQYSQNISWMHPDPLQAQYSLYDGYNLTLTNPSIPTSSSLSRTNSHYHHVPPAAVTQISSLHHMVTQQESCTNGQPIIYSPKPRRAHTHLSNISLPVNCLSVTQLPLPPLPQPTIFVGTHVPVIENLNTSCSFNTPPANSPVPVQIPPKPKCKTLPRDLFSSSISSLKNSNKSDLHSSKAAAISDLKMKDKSKKDTKNIISILFAPFISLKKKINKNKNTNETNPIISDSENSKSITNRSESLENQPICRFIVSDKIQPPIILASPYRLVTSPKTDILPTESSGNGSDCSSFHNRELAKSRLNDPLTRHKSRRGSTQNMPKNMPKQRPTSSGYGSIIIKGDSEVSSHNDSSSEYSASGLTSNKNHGGHSRLKHSISLSNYKSITDANITNLSKNFSTDMSNPSSVISREANFNDSVKTAEDLLLQERLKMSLNEERKFVIQLVETNRLRGVMVDSEIMNLMCFKCLDNFDVNNPIKRNECEKLIEKLDQEIEHLKPVLSQAQNHLTLITSFISHPQSR